MIQRVAKTELMPYPLKASIVTPLAQRMFLNTVVAFVSLLCSMTVLGQSSYMSEAQQNGFTLRKVVSDTVVPTGMNFSYSIYFSFPPGTSSVTITDVLPAGVTFQGISVIGCPPTSTVTPAINTNGTVTLQWGAVPAGCTGTIVITVQFPNGTTCNGTGARNRVCLSSKIGEVGTDFCTGYVSTTATATNPWHIGKWVLGAAWQGGSCPYATGDSVITYQVCVYKDPGTTGQLNLANALVRDTLPAGAYLQSSSCGATQTGNVITWNLGSLSALPMYNTQCCTFTVVYPPGSFPSGSQISNQAWLSGLLGSASAPCGQVNMPSQKTCVEIKNITQVQFSKWVYTNTQPGCNGRYLIYFCNTGTTTLTSFTIRDTLPTTLTSYSLGSYSSGVSPVISGNILTATSTTSLAPGQCVYIYVNFTIPTGATPGSTITNCAWVTYPGITTPLQACRSFTVTTAAPQACVWKEVCSKKSSYKPGDTLRYRLRIQNIGGLAIGAGATITDVLNPNLEYLGGESYYTSTTWNTPCQTTSNWGTVTPSISGNTLTYTLPTIPATCQNFLVGSCGYYGTGTVPYYYIEFNVRVRDTSALGNIPNLFTISGGGLSGSTVSNTEYVLVEGGATFTLDKAVAPDLSSWSSSITAPPGGNANFRLRLTVGAGSVALRNICFADLLPRDNPGGPAPLDRYILGPCPFNRGSVYDLSYNSTISTVPAASGERNPLSFARVDNFVPSAFTGGCGTAGTWSGGILAGDRNLGYYFGLTPVGAGNSATAIFNVAIPASAQNQEIACNTFAANGNVKHLIQSNLTQYIWAGQLESQRACITVQQPATDCIRMDVVSITSVGMNAAGNCVYSIVADITNPNISSIQGWFSSPQGSISPSSIMLAPGVTTQNFTFIDTPPSDFFACIRYGIVVNGDKKLCDSVCFDLPPCEPPHDECCTHFIHDISHTTVKYDADGNVWLNTYMIAGPVPIRRFSATIVSAQRRVVCDDVVYDWERIFGDIDGGNLSAPPAPGPMLLDIYSREAVWGPGECIDWMNGVFLDLNMVFPRPACKPCHDTLVFAIRYSFTDCECRTCDTVIYYTLVRTCDGSGNLLKRNERFLPGPGYENTTLRSARGNMSTMTSNNGSTDGMGQAASLLYRNVRTYALYFTNTNSEKKTVHALKLHAESGIQILAVGPSNDDGESTMLIPEKTESGTYSIKTAIIKRSGVSANETVTPIFVTVAGSLSADFGFTSLDEQNNPISSGRFTLANAISPVENQVTSSFMRLTALPNPTTNTSTLSFSLERSTTNAVLGIYNEQGKQVLNVLNNTTLEQGNHVMTTDVSSLASGVYYVVLRTPLGTVSQPMTIVR